MGYYTLDALIQHNSETKVEEGKKREKVRIVGTSKVKSLSDTLLHCVTEEGYRSVYIIRDKHTFNEPGIMIEQLTLKKPGISKTRFATEYSGERTILTVNNLLEELKIAVFDMNTKIISHPAPIHQTQCHVLYLEIEPLMIPYKQSVWRLIEASFIEDGTLILKMERRPANCSYMIEDSISSEECFIKEVFSYNLETNVQKALPLTRCLSDQMIAVKVIKSFLEYQKPLDPQNCIDTTHRPGIPWDETSPTDSRSGGSVIDGNSWLREMSTRKCLTQYTKREKKFFFKEFSGVVNG